MPFNVNEFLSHFDSHLDFAKVSKFEVRITPPTGLNMKTMDLRFQCEVAEIPGFTVNTVDNRRYGIAEPVAASGSFADITLTFICAGDMWEKKLFDSWLNLVIPFNRYNLNYKDTYISPKIEVIQYSESTQNDVNSLVQEDINQLNRARGATERPEPSRSYIATIYDAYPITVSPLQLNWGDDGVHRLAVTFKYNYWTTYDIQAQNGEVQPTTSNGVDSLAANYRPAIFDLNLEE